MTLNLKIGILIAVLAFLGFSHYKAFELGGNSAKLECLQANAEYQSTLTAKIDVIETSLNGLAKQSESSQLSLQDDIATILVNVKKKPITIVKEGKCIPSESFVDGINQAISKANRK